MEPRELKKLIAQHEGLKVDFKTDLRPQSLQDLSKDIAAFANAEGGHIIIGVDNKGNVVGVDWDAEKTQRVIQEGLNCVPQITVAVHEVHFPRAGTVVAIDVPKSTWIHMDANKRFPQRLGDRTALMDTFALLTLAKSRGLIGTESQLQYPSSMVRRKPDKIAFLADFLSDPAPFIRAEAATDLGNTSYEYAVEKLPAFFDKITRLLKDEDAGVRMAVLNMISNLNYRLESRKKKELLAVCQDILSDLSFNDKDINIRSRAVSLQAEVGASNIIEVIIKLLKSEPAETYSKLTIQNTFMRIAEAGLGYQLRKRLYAELAVAKEPEIQGRFKEALTKLRDFHWAG